jgi:hypothetical protein
MAADHAHGDVLCGGVGRLAGDFGARLLPAAVGAVPVVPAVCSTVRQSEFLTFTVDESHTQPHT